MQHFPYREQKFYELVLYIAEAFKDDASFGRIKLAKLLFNSDYRAFERYGEPISGATYIKDTWGHNPTQLLNAELDLVYRNDAHILVGEGEEEPRFIPHDARRRLIPNRPSRHEDFLSPIEIGLVDQVIKQYREAPAVAMSDESHKTIGWRIAAMKEEIPYETVRLRKPTLENRAVAQRIAAARGLE